MRDCEELFAALAGSEFRSRFELTCRDRRYAVTKSLPVILQHARHFINERLAPAWPAGDGKQTPMRGHPVFVAQHATATCCRNCLAKWHYIEKGQPLDHKQINYIVRVIEHWLLDQRAVSPDAASVATRQTRLFD